MDIQAQIEQLEGFAGDSMGMEPGDRQILAEIKTTLEALNKVYEAVLPLSESGTHIYDLDIALSNAIAEVKALTKE